MSEEPCPALKRASSTSTFSTSSSTSSNASANSMEVSSGTIVANNLQRRVRDLERELSEARDIAERHVDKVQSLQAELSQARQATLELGAEHDDLLHDMDSLWEENDNLKSTLADTEKVNARLKSQVKALIQKVEKAEEELERTREDSITAAEVVEEIERVREVTRRKVTDAIPERHELIRTVQALSSERDAMEKKICSMKEEREQVIGLNRSHGPCATDTIETSSLEEKVEGPFHQGQMKNGAIQSPQDVQPPSRGGHINPVMLRGYWNNQGKTKDATTEGGLRAKLIRKLSTRMLNAYLKQEDDNQCVAAALCKNRRRSTVSTLCADADSHVKQSNRRKSAPALSLLSFFSGSVLGEPSLQTNGSSIGKAPHDLLSSESSEVNNDDSAEADLECEEMTCQSECKTDEKLNLVGSVRKGHCPVLVEFPTAQSE